jgi:hypothetical protein
MDRHRFIMPKDGCGSGRTGGTAEDPLEGRFLAQKDGGWSMKFDPLEWTGFFLFAVGVYGTLYRSVTRHLTLWGVFPLDWLYLALLLGGASLLLLYSRSSPFFFEDGENSTREPWWKLIWRAVRATICMGLLAFALYMAIFK